MHEVRKHANNLGIVSPTNRWFHLRSHANGPIAEASIPSCRCAPSTFTLFWKKPRGIRRRFAT